ncbi:hypothetical protein HB912_06055 [Listeria aquatica]|uniref:Uncharacterized protein n=1 Tax=Listeria aquatica TaxID=1494960 RepID=A0A841ZM40_9LIST|nr:hypothetical protein [Listeria aquatica]MBC1521203.1 hypothetical protein [Listeria aquatica]
MSWKHEEKIFDMDKNFSNLILFTSNVFVDKCQDSEQLATLYLGDGFDNHD